MSTHANLEKPSRGFGSWLRFAFFNLAFVIVPLGVYFVYYVDTRVEQTTVRNFRALDAASERLREIISNLPKIVANVPVGLTIKEVDELSKRASEIGRTDDTTIRDLTEKLAKSRSREKSAYEEFRSLRWGPKSPGGEGASYKAKYADLSNQYRRAKDQSTAIQRELQQQQRSLIANAGCAQAPIVNALKKIESISNGYMTDFRAVTSATAIRLEPLLREIKTTSESDEITSSTNEDCDAAIANVIISELNPERRESCTQDTVTRRLVLGKSGVEIEVRNCRSFVDRAKQLAVALNDEAHTQALNRYGVRLTTSLASLYGSVASNVAPLFDQYLITDEEGRVLYTTDQDAAGFRYDAVTGAPIARRVPLDFINQVDLGALVKAEHRPVTGELASSLAQLGAKPEQTQRASEWDRYGVHSRLEQFQVADIAFSAFVHPFVVDGLAPLRTDISTGTNGSSNVGERTSSVLYMIGIVNRDSLSSESLQLRLSTVANALLLIGVIFGSLALLWIWTAGDRLVLALRHLLLLFASGLTATMLFTLFAAHTFTRSVDATTFDTALATVSHRLKTDFAEELDSRVGDLKVATATMLEFGKATKPNPEARSTVDDRFHCRPREDQKWMVDSQEEYPPFDLSFLLDNNGTQWQCLSYRQFDPPPIPLGFRKYYTKPRDGQLWQVSGLRDDIPIFIDRIMSILDGNTETVVSARPGSLCQEVDCWSDKLAEMKQDEVQDRFQNIDSAVVIGRFQSLEETILPPHLRFAVVNNATGETLFHSVRSRALATNLVRETEADKALLGLMDAKSTGVVDLDYHGTSIRAHVSPLIDGLPWTLLVYRGHELPDTLGVMTVSGAAAMSLGVLIPASILVALLGWLLSRVYYGGRSWRSALSLDLLSAAGKALLGVVFTATVMLILVAMLVPQFSNIIALLSVLGTCAAITAIGWRHARAQKARTDNHTVIFEPSRLGTGREHLAMVLALGLLIVGLAVIPTVGWYLSLRAELSGGLGSYLHNGVVSDVAAKCERHRGYIRRYKGDFNQRARVQLPNDLEKQLEGVFDKGLGWTLRYDPVENSNTPTPDACAAFSGAATHLGSVSDKLGPNGDDNQPDIGMLTDLMTSFSDLSSDIATRSAGLASTAGLASPSSVLNALLDDKALSNVSWQHGLILVLLLLSGIGLIWFVVISLADRALGTRTGMSLLPLVRIARLPTSWHVSKGPVQACVVHRSEPLARVLLSHLAEQEFPVVMRADWTNQEIKWQQVPLSDLKLSANQPNDPDQTDSSADASDGAEDRTLFVVESLERLLLDVSACRKLLTEFERLIDTGASLIVFSRLLPGNWLARITREVSGDFANPGEQTAFVARWSYVMGKLDVRRLSDRRVDLKRRFDQELERMKKPTIPDADYQRVYDVMLSEAKANPELLALAAAITRQASAPWARNSGHPMDLAFQRFGAAAAGYFHQLWATSTREERLQLFALSNGGFVNTTQTVALSSLANRGLIANNGIIHLRSAAFAAFIQNDLEHDALIAWRDASAGNIWRSIWPPIVVIAVLAIAFFVSSTPEALAPLAAILAASLGAVPVIGSLMRSARELRSKP